MIGFYENIAISPGENSLDDFFVDIGRAPSDPCAVYCLKNKDGSYKRKPCNQISKINYTLYILASQNIHILKTGVVQIFRSFLISCPCFVVQYTVASLRGGGGGGGGNPPRVSPFWGDTILLYQSNRKENNNMFDIIGNS